MIIPISITVLLYSITILFFMLGITIIYLIYKKQREKKAELMKETYIQEKQLLWYDFFREGYSIPINLIPRNKFEVAGIEEIFFVYLQNFKTEEITEKISRFSNEYLFKHLKQQLQSRRWSDRMNAMQLIIDFKMDRLVETCMQKKYEKLSHEEKYQRLKLIANLKEENFIEQLLQSGYPFSEYEYKRIFMELSEKIFGELLDDINQLPVPCRYSIIDLVGLKHDSHYLLKLHQLLQDEEQEIRIRSLRAIYEIGIISDINKYASFAESLIWQERLMFTKLLRYVSPEVSIPFIRILIQDPVWQVRNQAEKIILQYKNGARILEEISMNITDRRTTLLKEGEHQ